MARARNPICPRCKEREKAKGQGYCAECRRGKPVSVPIIKTKADAVGAVQRLAKARGISEAEVNPGPNPRDRRIPAEGLGQHAPFCQCLGCRQARVLQSPAGVVLAPRCSKHKLVLPCARCGA